MSDPRGRYAVEAGEFPVGIISDITLHDAARKKDLELSLEYPARAANAPLVIFSHGFGASSRSYVSLSAYWASQGYVVIKPTHADSRLVTKNAARTQADETPDDWRNRVRDVVFILDSLDLLEQRYPELAGKIDRSRIGVAGHGYGAFTAMLLAGVRTFPGSVGYADPRVGAVVAMSPQGPREDWGLTTQSWSAVTIPVLYLTGTLGRGETPEWRRQAFELATAPDQWLAVVEGAQEASFTGRLDEILEEEAERKEKPAGLPRLPTGTDFREDQVVDRLHTAIRIERAAFEAIRSVSLAFWDAYLRKEASGRNALEQGTGRPKVTVTGK